MILPMMAALVLTALGGAAENTSDHIPGKIFIHPSIANFPDPGSLGEGASLALIHLNSTPSTIAIRWELREVTKNGSVQASVVGYHVEQGKFISNPLHSSVREFVFHNLRVDTTYLVCVEVMETTEGRVQTHSRCVQIRTIPYIRLDSVLILLGTVFYMTLMCLLGYALWRRRTKDELRRQLLSDEAELRDYPNTDN